MVRPIRDLVHLFIDRSTLVLKIVRIVLVVYVFLDQALGERLRFVLHILLELVWLLAKGRSIYVPWSTRAILWLEVLVHHVGEEAGPVKLEIAPSVLLVVRLSAMFTSNFVVLDLRLL